MKLLRLLIEGLDRKFKIYVDMDGVLTDFDRQVKDMKIRSQFMWPTIIKIGKRFWNTMHWTPDGRQLWNTLKPYRPIILTAPINAKSSIEGKEEWIRNELGHPQFIIDRNKKKYARPNAILIDDYGVNIQTWKDAGGIGILHDSTADTIKQLKKLGVIKQ